MQPPRTHREEPRRSGPSAMRTFTYTYKYMYNNKKTGRFMQWMDHPVSVQIGSIRPRCLLSDRLALCVRHMVSWRGETEKNKKKNGASSTNEKSKAQFGMECEVHVGWLSDCRWDNLSNRMEGAPMFFSLVLDSSQEKEMPIQQYIPVDSSLWPAWKFGHWLNQSQSRIRISSNRKLKVKRRC